MGRVGYDIKHENLALCAFRLPQQELQQLIQLAEAKGINRSMAIREALRLYADFNSQHIREDL
jgi:metal-responsive CopG/Arc/MetJ family transcriptional regulator